MTTSTSTTTTGKREPRVVIVGAGIGGMVLALALNAHLGVHPVIVEQAPRFDDGAGGAIGLYPNGLRVLRDISPALLARVRSVAYPYLYRRWMRHDGSEVAVAEEAVLCPDDPEVQSVGVRRWRLQRALVDYAQERGLTITFGKRLERMENMCVDTQWQGPFVLHFADGSRVEADLVLAADGVKSQVRQALFGSTTHTEPAYTGITCLMGAARIPRSKRGICFPASSTSKCHACVYPTGDAEQVFQMYFPTSERPETWGNLSVDEARRECQELAERLRKEGWADEFIQPLLQAESVIRVGLRAREPLTQWVEGRVALLGDAAHPPVPYIGQGAMMAIEDAGVLALLMKQYCLTKDGGRLSLVKWPIVAQTYQQLRIARVTDVLGASVNLGQMQQQRAESSLYNFAKEWNIWLQVKLYGTMPVMFKGAGYDYSEDVRRVVGGNGQAKL